MNLHMNLGADSYDIIIERGGINRAGALFNLNRKVLVVTDDKTPPLYAGSVVRQCGEGHAFTFQSGEQSKTLATYGAMLSFMMKNGFTRDDCVVSVGGGIAGDIAGFAAASYMRGVDLYHIPTTLLSQLDSSIGGKTAVNLDGVKNIVGAFKQPKCVLIDAELLQTLPPRHFANGLAEAIKMSLTCDPTLFRLFETCDIDEALDTVIERSLQCKRNIVEQDEKENGVRKVLNFGHTVGHGIESLSAHTGLYHGECVAVGMLYMCAGDVRTRLENVLQKVGLPVRCAFDTDAVLSAVLHDKKCHNGKISTVYVPKIGTYTFRDLTVQELQKILQGGCA